MLQKGLTTDQANNNRASFGSNAPHISNSAGWKIVLEVVKEPMVILLLVACFFYFFLQQFQEGFIMAGAIILVAGISVYQQVRSENAVKALNKLTQERTTVLRDGIVTQIPSDELVFDDIIQVTEGQHVSADSEILELNDLAVDESILTGESFAVEKNAPGQLLFSGTTITSGMAWSRVTAVGSATKIGKLGKSMEAISKEKTPLQIQTGNFVKRMALFGLIAFLFVWLYNYIGSGDILDGLLHGLTMAMSVLPEEIPVALSTFMALGAYRMIKNNILAKQPQTVEALGAATVICVDKTGTITENKMQVAELFELHSNRINSEPAKSTSKESLEILRIAMLASESDPFDPMEVAIHECYNAAFPAKPVYSMIKEYPLAGIHPKMTHVYLDENNNRIISCKGAPEGIIRQSNLSPEQKKLIDQRLQEMAKKGHRVLAVGVGITDVNDLPESQDAFSFEFLGLLSLNDPPKKNISEVIQNFYESGIDVKMITGDYPETAMSIASQIKLRNSDHCVTGSEIAAMNESQLEQALKSASVFARVMPETKLRIITALKASGEVVAMTGDGVNDGPALKAAHIGIAMGKRGSEVARKAASLVLTNDDLSSMVTAVAYGRNIYTNLKKAIQYIISIHIPLISIVTLPLLLGWKFPNIFMSFSSSSSWDLPAVLFMRTNPWKKT
jgi:P-type Ca2+ transporter type 2C